MMCTSNVGQGWQYGVICALVDSWSAMFLVWSTTRLIKNGKNEGLRTKSDVRLLRTPWVSWLECGFIKLPQDPHSDVLQDVTVCWKVYIVVLVM